VPTYDYQCKACHHVFEKFQSITSSSLRKCPACGKLTLKRLIGSGGGIIFKGSGWPGQDIARKSEKRPKGAFDEK